MANKITSIGAVSAFLMKNILGDVLDFSIRKKAHIALTDVGETRLLQSQLMGKKFNPKLKCLGQDQYTFVFT